MNRILVAHAMATFFMVGLIWFVQVVHYPLLDRVGEGSFPRYEADHCRFTSWVVGPPMLIEVTTALMLVWYPLPPETTWLLRIGGMLLLIIWLSTALLQVPHHRELSLSFCATLHRRLVAANWVRTVAWSLRGLIVLAVLTSRMQ